MQSALNCMCSLFQLPSGIHELLFRRAVSHRPSAVLSSHAGKTLGFGLQQRRNITINQLDAGRNDRERVVILGSGWAGYTLARQLDSKKYQAVVVSPRSYFAFTPLLASTSVGTLEFRTALEPIRSRRSKVAYFQGWADAVNFQERTVLIEESVDDPTVAMAPTADRLAQKEEQRNKQLKEKKKQRELFSLAYDKLIIAVGSYSQTFGTPGVKEHAFFLKDVGDARRIRNRILGCFEAAALPTTSDEMRWKLLNFAVVGGGPTGIEFSAELHDIITEDMVKIYPELIPFHKIAVYDVADKVLPMFDEKLGKYAMDTFRREGISIKTRHHVESLRPGSPGREAKDAVEEHACYTLKIKEEGEVGVGMVVWSTGLMQNPFIAHACRDLRELPERSARLLESGHEASGGAIWEVRNDAKTGSVVTDDRLRLKLVAKGKGESDSAKNHEAILTDVWAIGDCAILEGSVYPATAQVASQKAVWLAKRLNKDDIEKEPFSWKNMGVMAYIGNWKALLQGGGGSGISGRAAWLIWRGAYLTKSVSIRNKILIPIYWVINWIFGRDISRF